MSRISGRSALITKLFRTYNIETVKICQAQFHFETPSTLIEKNALKSLILSKSGHYLCS